MLGMPSDIHKIITYINEDVKKSRYPTFAAVISAWNLRWPCALDVRFSGQDLLHNSCSIVLGRKAGSAIRHAAQRDRAGQGAPARLPNPLVPVLAARLAPKPDRAGLEVSEGVGATVLAEPLTVAPGGLPSPFLSTAPPAVAAAAVASPANTPVAAAAASAAAASPAAGAAPPSLSG